MGDRWTKITNFARMKQILYGLALAFAVTGAWAQESVLGDIERNNTELQMAKRQGIRAVLAVKAQNGLDDLEVEYSPFFTRGVSGMTSSELVVKQSFELPWAYTSRNRMARLQTTENEVAYNALRQEVLLRARNLIIEVGGLQRTLDIMAVRGAIADSLKTAYARMSQRGDATILEYNLCLIESMTVAKEQARTQAAMDKAMAELTALNGGHRLEKSEVISESNRLEKSLEASGFAAHDARIGAAESRVESARQMERVATSESMPRLTVGYRRNTDGDISSNGVLVGASIPLFSNKKRRTIAREERETAELQRQQTVLEVERERTALQIELGQAEEMLRASDTKILRETLTLLERSLALGETSLTEYMRSCAPIYAQLEEVTAIRTLYLQTKSAQRRGEL